jgi:hypothetical protein
MKRWAIGSVAFFAALLIGFLVADGWKQPGPVLGESDVNGFPTIVVNAPLAPSIPAVPESASVDIVTEEFIDTFTDEKRIGRKRKNKVELKCIDRGDIRSAKIDFFSRARDGTWTRRQTIELPTSNLMACSPEVKDFNNDGFGDLTFISGTAARGANEIRTLFIYDKNRDELLHIKNSEDYPNLEYNKKLDCIDSWMFHGATTTVFLRIEGDELKDFASVDTGTELVVTLRGKYGRKEISRKRMNLDDVYTRYSSYDPPKP